jgi:hypothetical protein
MPANADTAPPTRRGGGFGILPAVAVLTLISAVVAPAQAQRLEGHVFDAATGEPIATALVQLIAADSTVLAGTATDARGRFQFALPEDARFLRVTRLGYSEVREPLSVLRAEGSALVVRLPPLAIPVPAVQVEAERRNRFLEGVGFYNRQRLGIGEFITRDMIERNHANARTAGDILTTLRGLMLRAGQEHDLLYMSRSLSRIEGVCGARIYMNGAFHGEEVPHIRPDDIEAMEVFRGPADVPSQYGGAYGACGVVLIWLRTGQS